MSNTMDTDESLISLIEHIDAPIFVLERSEFDEPVYTAMNKKARIKANLHLEHTIGKTAVEIYDGQFGKLAYKYHKECLATGKTMSYDLTLNLEGKDRHVRTTLSPRLNSNKKVTQIVGTSNLVDAEYIIRDAHAKAIALNAETERLINISAHDLRSPMRNMKNITELLAKDFVDLGDGKLAMVDLLHNVSANTIELIGDIIEYAQTSSASESVEEFQLLTVCRKTLSILNPNHAHTADIQDLTICCDKIPTEITLRNLIDNSFKHNPAKAIKIEISARSLDKGMIEITVCDNGRGMENPSALFEKKCRKKAAVATAYKPYLSYFNLEEGKSLPPSDKNQKA